MSASRLSRWARAGEGEVIGGEVALRVDASILGRLAAGRTTVLVSGTNGKTTIAALLSAALGARGPTCTNATGANLANGLVGALLRDGSKVVVLETDEAVLQQAIREVGPSIVVLSNLSRDQLDRLHEVRQTAGAWREELRRHPRVKVVANGDDPIVAWVADGLETTWVGAPHRWNDDAATCLACGGRIEFGPGDWSCTRCDRARPTVAYQVAGDSVVGPDGARHALDLRLPGQFNRTNAAMALAAAELCGVEPSTAAAGWGGLHHVADRYRVVEDHGRSVRLLMAKNPASWLEVLHLLSQSDGPVVIALNANVQDGLDPSWIWDVPFERLRGRRVVCAGERALDLAVRLSYAGVEYSFAPEPRQALRMTRPLPVDVVANYSAFQQIRRLVVGG